MTGYYTGGKYAGGALRPGVAHYLEKPFTRQEFLKAINEALSGKMPELGKPSTCQSLLVDLYYSKNSGLLI